MPLIDRLSRVIHHTGEAGWLDISCAIAVVLSLHYLWVAHPVAVAVGHLTVLATTIPYILSLRVWDDVGDVRFQCNSLRPTLVTRSLLLLAMGYWTLTCTGGTTTPGQQLVVVGVVWLLIVVNEVTCINYLAVATTPPEYVLRVVGTIISARFWQMTVFALAVAVTEMVWPVFGLVVLLCNLVFVCTGEGWVTGLRSVFH